MTTNNEQIRERLARQDVEIEAHSEHFRRLNGTTEAMSRVVSEQGRILAVMQATLERIEAATSRKAGVSTQWQLVIVGAGITFAISIMGFIGTAILTLVVLLANGQL